MIIWINGPFGVGKTSVARALCERRGGWLFDPEKVGFALRLFTGPGDFQDLRAWRTLTRSLLRAAAAFPRDVVVPMTLVDPRYFDEVVGGLRRADVPLRHFTLLAPRAVVAQRLAARGSARGWGEAQLERCLSALSAPSFAEHVDTTGCGVAELAKALAARLDAA